MVKGPTGKVVTDILCCLHIYSISNTLPNFKYFLKEGVFIMAKAKKLPSGNWRVQAYATINGSVVKKSFTADTKKQAELLAIEWQNGKKTLSEENITLSEAYKRYIESKSEVLSPNTIREYKRSAERDLQDIMQIKLNDLTLEKIQISINKESLNHSPKTVRNINGLLSAVLKVFKPDFVLNTSLPQKTKKPLYIPTENEIKQVLQAAKNTNMELPIMLAVFGPLRRSEISALTKDDIDGLKVTVNKSLAKNADGEWVIKPPKTYAGYRTVEMPQLLKPLLDNVVDKVTPYKPETITKKFHRLLKENNINNFRFHDLRHYCVSYLHSINIPTKYIMARGGWSSETVINNIYNHMLKDKNITMTEKINNSFDDNFN